MADDDYKHIVETLVTAGILATLSATVRAMLVKNEEVWTKVRTFIAGVCVGVLLAWILRNSNSTTRESIVAVASAFISTAYPLLETIVKNYVNKKGKTLVQDTSDN